MGVGKTTLGKIVAKKQNLRFFDSDLCIEEKLSMKISKIFEHKGEAFFRSEEEKQVLKILKNTNSVIALGGGAFINNKIRSEILKNAISIWLDDSLENISKKTKWKKNRPLLNKENNREIIKKLYAERKDIYKLANYKINCNNLNKEDLVKKIIDFYEKY